MQKLTMKEMMDKFDPEVHQAIREAIRNTGATELLWAENQQMDSSARVPTNHTKSARANGLRICHRRGNTS